MYTLTQWGSTLRHHVALGLLALVLTACSGGADRASLGSESGLGDVLDAATGSLEDLNLKRQEIPPMLRKVAANPYRPPAKMECKCIRDELAQLETLLGPDVQAKEFELASNDGFMSDVRNMELPTQEETAHGAHDALMGVIRSETSIIPFRSVVRAITGADKHQRRLAEAYQAGKLRRAYLRGIAETRFGKKCLKAPLPKETPPAET